MGREHPVTDRETLRERPPHILLTNYKILDFLMIRPTVGVTAFDGYVHPARTGRDG